MDKDMHNTSIELDPNVEISQSRQCAVVELDGKLQFSGDESLINELRKTLEQQSEVEKEVLELKQEIADLKADDFIGDFIDDR